MTTTVRAACSVVSPRGRPYRENPAITAFYEDLLTPFGVGFDEESLRTGRNVFHQDLVDNLIDADDAGSRKPDLIIVTHALPDVHPFTTVASDRLGKATRIPDAETRYAEFCKSSVPVDRSRSRSAPLSAPSAAATYTSVQPSRAYGG